MGSYVSAGKSNDELIDHLIEDEFIKTPLIQRVFRAVDRGNYCISNDQRNAYKDIAWKVGNLHVSAPCVYSVVMEALKLQPGMTFLNLGSGTGYLSTLAGLLLGTYGTNHGVELFDDVIEFAYERLEDFLTHSEAIDQFDFCEPTFTLGNCLLLDNTCQQYDRVYCGASCPSEYESHMKNLIKVGGILIMPRKEKLLKITRIDEETWNSVKILTVSFAPLVCPSPAREPSSHILLGIGPPKLQLLCRSNIRNLFRKNIDVDKPNILAKIIQKEQRHFRQVSRIIIPFVNESDDSSDLDYDSDTPEYRISSRLPARMTTFFEDFIRRHTELPLLQDIVKEGTSNTNSENSDDNLHTSTRNDSKERSSDDEIFSLFTVTNVHQQDLFPSREEPSSDYDQPPSASTRSKKRRKRAATTSNDNSNDASSSTQQKSKIRRTAATVFWKKHKVEKKEVKPTDVDIADEDNYTSQMIKRICALPLPFPLIRYLNYK